jgi:hypothetical protein
MSSIEGVDPDDLADLADLDEDEDEERWPEDEYEFLDPGERQ